MYALYPNQTNMRTQAVQYSEDDNGNQNDLHPNRLKCYTTTSNAEG